MSSTSSVEARAAIRRGDWLQTYTGVQFWPIDPRPDEIRLEDIAHALSLTCRFGGHTKEFYSVAQHSVIVADLAAGDREGDWRAIALSGLFHDATEAYLVDVPRPIKRSLTNYALIEDALAGVIKAWFFERFGITLDFKHHQVKHADEVALATEARDLLGPKPAPWRNEIAPSKRRIDPLTPINAKRLFLKTFDLLMK